MSWIGSTRKRGRSSVGLLDVQIVILERSVRRFSELLVDDSVEADVAGICSVGVLEDDSPVSVVDLDDVVVQIDWDAERVSEGRIAIIFGTLTCAIRKPIPGVSTEWCLIGGQIRV